MASNVWNLSADGDVPPPSKRPTFRHLQASTPVRVPCQGMTETQGHERDVCHTSTSYELTAYDNIIQVQFVFPSPDPESIPPGYAYSAGFTGGQRTVATHSVNAEIKLRKTAVID
jgi:hypothetical protein